MVIFRVIIKKLINFVSGSLLKIRERILLKLNLVFTDVEGLQFQSEIL